MKDCTVIGGGPAGLNATLVLGRARRNVILVDSNEARNKVTSTSHGFVTRDGITPSEFREFAHQEFSQYRNGERMGDEKSNSCNRCEREIPEYTKLTKLLWEKYF